MRLKLLQIFAKAPVTATCIFLCSVLFSAVWCLTLWGMPIRESGEGEARVRRAPLTALHAQEMLGAALGYPIDGNHAAPLKLWEGQWWRVFLSAFHHGNDNFGVGLFHVVGNCLCMWMLGLLLEPRLGSWRTALLVLMSVPVTILPEYLAGSSVVGISGVICAQFGYLLVLRTRDRELQEWMPDELIRFVMLFLVAGIPMTYFDLFPVANLSHFSGLGYGLFAGWVFQRESPWRVPARLSFYAAHALILVGFYLVQHPIGNGVYHLLYAEQSRDPEERLMHFRRAVALEPGLEAAWIELSREYRRRQDIPSAWTAALLGVHYNPSAKMIREAKKLGHRFQTVADRQHAKKLLDDVFDDEAELWEDQLLAQAPFPGSFRIFNFGSQPASPEDDDELNQFPEDLGSQLLMPKPSAPLPPPDPNAANSAAVGSEA